MHTMIVLILSLHSHIKIILKSIKTKYIGCAKPCLRSSWTASLLKLEYFYFCKKTYLSKPDSLSSKTNILTSAYDWGC